MRRAGASRPPSPSVRSFVRPFPRGDDDDADVGDAAAVAFPLRLFFPPAPALSPPLRPGSAGPPAVEARALRGRRGKRRAEGSRGLPPRFPAPRGAGGGGHSPVSPPLSSQSGLTWRLRTVGRAPAPPFFPRGPRRARAGVAGRQGDLWGAGGTTTTTRRAPEPGGRFARPAAAPPSSGGGSPRGTVR